MKKYIIILMIIFTLIFAGCYGLQTQPVAMNASPTPMATMLPNRSQPTSSKTYTESPTNAQDALDSFTFEVPYVLIDDTEIKVILEGVESGQEDKINFLFHVESTAKTAYKMYIDAVSINNYMIPDCGSYFDLNPDDNKDVNYYINFMSVLESYGVENISDISFHYMITDDANSEVKYSGTAKLDSGVQITNDYFATEDLIGSNDYVEVYFVNAYSAYETQEYYELLIHNKGTEAMEFSADAMAINGISIPHDIKEIILPNSYYLHSGKVLISETGFMTNINKAASVSMQMSGQNIADGNVVFSSAFEFTADEDAVNQVPQDTQVILSDENILLSIGKLGDSENISAIVVYIQNSSSEIYDFNISDVTFNNHPLGTDFDISLMPNTYAYRILDVSGDLAHEDYEMSLKYEYGRLHDANTKGDSLSFTLEK